MFALQPKTRAREMQSDKDNTADICTQLPEMDP